MSERLQEFDYSVRVNLASNAICEQQEPTLALKLHLEDENAGARQVMLELNEEQLAKVLQQFAVIHRELKRRP